MSSLDHRLITLLNCFYIGGANKKEKDIVTFLNKSHTLFSRCFYHSYIWYLTDKPLCWISFKRLSRFYTYLYWLMSKSDCYTNKPILSRYNLLYLAARCVVWAKDSVMGWSWRSQIFPTISERGYAVTVLKSLQRVVFVKMDFDG